MKNKLHVPKQPFFNIKIKNEIPILAVARLFLKMQNYKYCKIINKFVKILRAPLFTEHLWATASIPIEPIAIAS